MTTEDAFLQLVRLGFFMVDAAGRVWRKKLWTRSGNTALVDLPRRAERPVSGGYLQVGVPDPPEGPKHFGGGKYTGRQALRTISYIVRDAPHLGLMPGFAVLGIR